MKKGVYTHNLLVPIIKILVDSVSIELAFVFSFWLRFYSPLINLIPATKGIPPFINYLYFSIFLLLIYIFLFSTFRSYRTRIFTNFSQDMPVIFKVCFLGILFAMSGAFLYREFSYSRLVFLLILINTNIFLLSGRFIFHHIKKYFIKKGFDVLNVYLMGSTDLLPKVVSQIQTSKAQNFNITGYVAVEKIDSFSIPYKGSISDLPAIFNGIVPDGFILAYNQFDYHNILEVIKLSEGKNIELFYVPDILDLLTSNFNVIEAESLILLQLKAFTLSGWQGFIKRIFDITISIVSLVLLTPLFLFSALLIKLTSRGSVFYLQKRIGMDGIEFTMIKFRSMRSDAEYKTGPVWAAKNDPRVMKFGRFLRRTSIDELPQLFNVLKGDMSIVGPRPERPHFVQQFTAYVPKYIERHRVRSGITGWAQVNGLRGQSPIEERTKYDIFYIENWSLWFDIKIIILTFIAVFKGQNAY